MYVPLQIKSTKNSKNDRYNHSCRAAIVSFRRGDTAGLFNMLRLIEYFYPQSAHKYSVLI